MTCFIKPSTAQTNNHQYDPPWNTPPKSAVNFTVPGVDNVPDLFGDINDPQLVVFFAGNQFMVVDELIEEFRKAYPKYKRIFVETLPPGILAKQITGGSVTIGNLKIDVLPDIYTAGKSKIEMTPEWFSKTEVYAKNRLAIMVQKGNPKNIKGLADLGRNDIRVSMPNPEWEGIGKRIEEAYVKAGGEQLKEAIMQKKVKDSSTFLTQIHHRQSPMRILYNQSDAAPVWFTETYYQQMIDNPVETIEIPTAQNIEATYVAGLLKSAPHKEAAKDFMNFLLSKEAKGIYTKFGFKTSD
ncbi:MAG: substrate-binding domain-containing protein [Bacteroidota bacterium]|nr:substrate-binding domain-containing protein [Bacteroidota bacterium]